jgi:hypothetical protein
MKIYSLEFVSTRNGAGERIWHTNRRALERYSRTLVSSSFQVRGIKTFDIPTPLSEARVIAFLNAHCADFAQPDIPERADPARERNTPGIGSR